MYESLENIKILSVVDFPPSQQLVELNLEKFNVNITTCDDGEKAIEYLKNEEFDIILMDLYMPNMSGIQCIKKIRKELYIDKPIIVLSSAFTDFHREIEPLINGYLRKPYKKYDFINLIDSLIKKSR